MASMIQELVQQTGVLEIVGDVIRVRASGVAFEDLAVVENVDGSTSPAKVVGLDHDVASLQVFAGGKGLSTGAKVRFHELDGVRMVAEDASPDEDAGTPDSGADAAGEEQP